MPLASVLFCGQLKPLKYIHFNAAFGKLSLKKAGCSSTEKVPLLFARVDELLLQPYFCALAGEHSWKEKSSRSCSRSSVIQRRNKTSCAYISLQSAGHGKSSMQKCKNENHMHCFTHFPRNPPIALCAVLLKPNSAVQKKKKH